MPNVLVKTLYRPVGQTALARFAARAVELGLDAPTTEEIIEALSVNIAFFSITRQQGMLRSHNRDKIVEWVSEITGLKRDEINLKELDFEHSSELLMQLQAVDILSGLSWEDCAGIEFGGKVPPWFSEHPEDLWVANEDPAHWSKAEDWFVTECLSLLWEANPQLALSVGQVPLALEPEPEKT